MSTQLPSSMQAVIVDGKDKTSIQTVPTPRASGENVVVKVDATAINPTDWKGLRWFGNVGTTLGSDFAGTVAEIPEGLKTNVKLGDRVFSLVHGGTYKGIGAFAQYAAQPASCLTPIPSEIDMNEAAGLGIGVYTAIFGLFQSDHLGIASPDPNMTSLPPVDEKKKILVWSGASNVGQYVVQLARACGMYVITTSNPRHYDYLTSLGASATYDYGEADIAKKLAKEQPGIHYAYDTYSENGSAYMCLDAMDQNGPGRYVSVLKVPDDTKTHNASVTPSFVLLYSLDGKELNMLGHFRSEAKCQEDVRYWQQLISDKFVPKFLASGLLKPAPIELLSGGLEAVPEGLELVRSGKNLGRKIIIPLA